MSSAGFRAWVWIHRWSSLVCTVFLLLLCLTGLPLVFTDEIADWLNEDPPYAQMPADTPMVNLDQVAQEGRRRYPGQIITTLFVDDDEPQVVIAMAPSWQSAMTQPGSNHLIKFDARTGAVLKEPPLPNQQGLSFMRLMLRLHTDLFAELPGRLFLCVMGALFFLAVVSGLLLYGPFTHKLDFGEVRTGRSARVKWLDLHNLLGIATLVWALVVGLTGALNELTIPLFTLWQKSEVQVMLQPWRGKAAAPQESIVSPQRVYEEAQRALPGMRVTSMTFPGSRLGSPEHYLVWAKGDSPLTSRLFNPMLIDAHSGKLAVLLEMPWYLRALEVSRPLHFGDYGGLPLKVLWAVLDLVTIAVLGSGLYLWFARRSRRGRGREVMLPQGPDAAAISPKSYTR